MKNHSNKFICVSSEESLQFKPFECDITKITNMTEHKQIPPSVKSYECEICTQTLNESQLGDDWYGL